MSVYEGKMPFSCDTCEHKCSVHEEKKLSNVLYSICESTFAEKAIAFAAKDSIQNGYWIVILVKFMREKSYVNVSIVK